jgi:NarL family two-component system response regulator LiaR
VTVRLLIVEDHTLVREGTAQLLERDPGLSVVGQAGSGEEAVTLILALQPDLALVDVELPGMNGIEVVRAVRQGAPGVRCLLLSAHNDRAYVLAALEADAAGYLLKTATAEELVHAVRAVAAGALVLDETVSRGLSGHWRRDDAPALTARESDVLALLARGWSNKQIAGELRLGLRTVETHVSSVLSKLGLRTRTEAALYAVAHRLVTPMRSAG